jgi:amino acid permease
MLVDDAFKRAVAFVFLIFFMTYLGIELTAAVSVLSYMTVDQPASAASIVGR